MILSEKVWPQYLLAVLCNLGVMGFGLGVGWLSPWQGRLMSEGDSPLGNSTQPLTLEEISWVGAMPMMSLLICSPLLGWILERLGRKLTLLVSNLPYILCYAMLLYSSNVWMLYIARFISGFASAGCLTTTPIYVNECTQDSVRGMLSGISGIFINLGVIMAFALGGFTSYTVMNLVCMSFTIVFLCFYFWLPESPAQMLAEDRVEEAEKALLKLRGGSPEQIAATARSMHAMLKDAQREKMTVTSVFRDKASRTGILYVCVVYFIQQFGGISAILGYAVHILEKSGSALSPPLAATLTGVMQLTGSTTGALLVDRLGRRSLLLLSCAVTSVALLVFTSYVFFQWDFNWLPPACIMVYIVFYAVGLGTVPFVLLPEMFTPQVRSVAVTAIGTWVSLIAFIISYSFPAVSATIGLSGAFLIFTATNLLGFIFVYQFMFETKGLSLQEIVWRLRHGKDYTSVPQTDSLELQQEKHSEKPSQKIPEKPSVPV